MNLLLDTHVLLWWLSDDDQLGRSARQAIETSDNLCAVSAVSEPKDLLEQIAGSVERRGRHPLGSPR